MKGPNPNKLSLEEKYIYYEKSVQCVGADADFIRQEYKRQYGKEPKILREDFAGTGMLSCHWVTEAKDRQSYAIDLDDEPLNYGKMKHLKDLKKEEQNRVHYTQGNVLDSYKFTPDIVVAFNFSYFIFKKRKDLLNYFTQIHKSLKGKGAFYLDLFGGSECHEPIEEETEHDGFSYFWDLAEVNALKQEVLYYIHFKIGKKKFEKVFTYDWRMWGIQELVDILEDAGFSKIYTYWEGDDGEGEGNGIFTRSTKEDNCSSWVTYIMACP
jgi:hypothetical protein